MNYQYISDPSQTQRCYQCKELFKQIQDRYFCCERKKSVCNKCSQNICRYCNKRRENKIVFDYCCNPRCRRIYDLEDMFYDFKGKYQICPKCLRKDYQFYYQKALKANQQPDQVQLSTKAIYPYKDLVNYFKNWCFSCANKIGEQDAYQMIRGPRICGNCIALNTQKISNMIRCIGCEGYIHTLKQIFQNFGSQTEVLCIYCAEKHKQQLEKASNLAKNNIKQPAISKISNLAKSSIIKSALKIFKLHSEKSNENVQKMKKADSTASKLSSINSYEIQEQNVPLKIRCEKTTSLCNLCNSALEQSSLFLIKKADSDLTTSILKLVDQNKGQVKLCPLCFSFELKDHGQMIQFSVPQNRSLKQQEQNTKQPKISFVGKKGLNQNIFEFLS